MPGLPGEVMTREKKYFFLKMTSDVTHILACDKTIFRIGIPTQRKQTKERNANSQQNLAVFLTGTDSENKIIKLLHRKGKKKN